ncbi:MAG: DUF1080 domain-containing protein, partial [Verrucomicrobiota bacterium]
GGTWTTADGVLEVKGGNGPRAVLKELMFSDFELEMDISLDRNTQAGPVFRVRQSKIGIDAYRGYYAGIHEGKNQSMWGSCHPGWKSIVRKPSEIEPDRWYNVKLQVNAETVRFWVDDVEAGPTIHGVDDHFRKGRIGLRVLGGGARFRNLVIRPISSTR